MCETLIFAPMKRHLLIAFCLLMAMSGFAQNIDSLFNVYENAPRRDKVATARPLLSALAEEGVADDSDTLALDGSLNHLFMVIYKGMSLHGNAVGDYEAGLRYAEMGLSLVPSDSLDMLNEFYSYISVFAFYLQDFDKALKACEQRLAILPEDSKTDRASVCNTIASIYKELARDGGVKKLNDIEKNYYEQALRFSEEAVALRREMGNDGKGLLAAFLGKQSEILSTMGRPNEAIAVIDEAIALDLEAGRMERYYQRLVQKGHALFQNRQFEEAREAYRESLQHTDKERHLVTYRTLLNQLGYIETELQNYDAAIAYFEEYLGMEQKSGMADLSAVYRNLTQCYRKSNPAKALEYSEKFIKLNDSVRNAELMTQLTDFQVKYETAEKERQIAEQQGEIERRGLMIRMWAIIAILMVVGIAVIAYFAIRNRRQSKELQRLNETRSRLFSIITHDLKTPVAAQNQMLKTMCKNYDALPPELIKEQCFMLSESSDTLNDQLLNLVQWARTETGKMSIEPAYFRFADEVSDSLRQLNDIIAAKHINIDNQVPDDLIVHADRNVVGVVLRNLVSNAVKFSYEGGSVIISTHDEGTRCWLSVKDNGMGISPAKMQQIFQFTVRSSKGTAGEMGTGLGLYVSKLMMDKAGCDMKVESTEGQGSIFSFSVPKE